MDVLTRMLIEAAITGVAAFAGVKVAIHFLWQATRDNKASIDHAHKRIDRHIENHGGH